MIKTSDKVFFKKNGWCVIKNFFSKKELEKAKKKIFQFFKKNINNYSGRDINFVGTEKKFSKLNSFHKLEECDYFKTLSQKKKILLIPKYLLSSKKLSLRACELFAKPSKIGLAAPVHQDNYYWCIKNHKALTMWISLNKVSKKNGGVFYFNGSHNHGIFDHVPSYKKGSSQKVANRNFLKKFKMSYPKLEAGDVLIHHSLVVHGSSKNISNNSRRGWTIQFKDKNANYDLEHIKNYEKSLNKQIKLRL